METEKKLDDVSVHSNECRGLPPSRLQKQFARFTYLLTRWGVETNGIDPIPPEQRTDTKMFQMFFVWFSANMNVLGIGIGSAGPAFFGLGLKQSLIIILIVDVISCIIPSYFAVFGPKLGARSMVQARYSWGYYGAMIPSALNVFTMQGYLILNSIIAGQTLASVSEHLNATLGIVIIGVISMLVTFCGYKVIHWYEVTAWIPNVIAFIIMLGVGGKHLSNAPPTAPVTPSTVVTFATTTASSVISWCTMTPDYGVYHNSEASTIKIFSYTYTGFITASITVHFLGAIFAACAVSVPAWEAGFDNGNNVGGLIAAVLSPLGGFGKFLCVLLAISIPSACAPTMYTFGSSFMTIGSYFAMVPRYVYIIVAEAILIPVAVIGATSFYETFVDVLSIIGYWSVVWSIIILTEHFVFRRNTWARYDMEGWDTARRLPWGLAAVFAFACAFGIIIPSMDQAWYTGPIAKAGTGDIGILAGSGVAFLLYLVFRTAEKAWTGR
ncbi:hypothetical protein NM688_g5523 [Phlebia brevispora]|uniref:Uncharacterized protein n=1 Tax=Phlebia brevispora TaxID=194682 RepID=A0ACC1STU9_9APHY|nr:hypothetical protein NM688_g5523 [Phlebia brevispora]